MASQSNGRAKKPKKATPNGHLNGHLDNSKLSGPAGRSSVQRKQKSTIMGRLISIAARLAVWYLIITIAFRCPPSLTKVSKSSPQICKPYLQARSHAAPYLDPYYQTYVAPQVQKVQPYIDRFDANIYTPVSAFTKDKYSTYGAHRVESARKYLESEWDRTVRPQIHNVQKQAKGQYDIYLGPHVKQLSDAIAPHYARTKESLSEIYYLTVLPNYEAARPYSRKAYAQGHYVVSHIIFPYVRYAKDISWAFITRTAWPKIRILYGDNVEPQLVRIRERLGRHRDQQKIESVVEALESELPTAARAVSTEKTQASQATQVIESTETSSSSAPSGTPSGSGWDILNSLWPSDSLGTATKQDEVQTETRPAEPEPTGVELREKLNNDLRQWQSKFAVAADKGAEDLERRVAEITDRQVENSVKGHGAALVVQLEETAKSIIAKFKEIVKKTVAAIPEDASEEDLESAYGKCIAKTRELGLEVKEKAEAVRNWKIKYDQETDDLVRAAVASAVEVLERIHGLGLQEVGMRWAWTEGVTYDDWQKYHKVRITLAEWQTEVEAVGAKHEGLRIAHEEAKALEDKAMNIASKMVEELVRLKDVSRWKIWAGDSTDDFSKKAVPARAFKAATVVSSNIEDIASKVSETVIDSETPATESVASSIKEKVSDASSKASEAIFGSASPAVQDKSSKVEKKYSAISSQASDASSQVFEAVVGTETAVESGASAATEAAQSKVAAAKEVIEDKVEAAKEAVEEKADFASAQPKQQQQKVMGGAMAEVIAEAKEIVFDDDNENHSLKLQDMVAQGGDRAAELSRAVSEALFGPSKTLDTLESVTSLASQQYESALSAASSVLYGTEQQLIESATSVASEKFAHAVTAASYAIFGTPTPTAIYKTIQVEASSRYDQAISLANKQYSHAKSQLSELVSGTPKPAHETMFSIIENAYSDSLAAANERLQVALQYTDSIKNYVSTPTQGYFESVSSIAASKLSEGLSRASAQFTSQPTPALDGARRQYYEAIGLAHARYSEFLVAASDAVYGPQQGTAESLASVASEAASSAASNVSGSAESAASQITKAAGSLASQASSGIVGTETPWTESVASEASQNWESLIAKASSQVYGAPTPWAESVYSQAGAYGAQATAGAVQQYSAVQALISELIVGKEPNFTESIMSRFASAYYTGVPAAVSYAGETLESATSLAGDAYASASSVVSSVFTPPPAIETILSQASEQINLAVESASVAVYGTSKGKFEQASESIASAYSSVQAKANDAIYGTQQAHDSFLAVAASAQAAINEAIFGTPTATGYVASVTSGAEIAYSSLSSAAGEMAADAASAISSAVYGPEQDVIESASSRLAAAVEAANSRISDIYASASSGAEQAASSVSSAVTKATKDVKDEL